MENQESFLAWHFLPDNGLTQFKPHRRVVVGETLRTHPPLAICSHGLHFSVKAIDALSYAPGNLIERVRVSGKVLMDSDKGCATERMTIWMASAESTLREFARWSALQVVDLWNPPEIVRYYLETGDESIRDAAWNAARDVAWDAAWDAARDVAWDAAWNAARAAARDATWDAARAIARDVAWNATWNAVRAAAWNAARDVARAAAWNTARDVAWNAAWADYNIELERRLNLLAPKVSAK